jgi:hypothetical protein
VKQFSITHFNAVNKEFNISKSAFIPTQDHDFLVWFDHFMANLTPEYGVSEPDVTALKTANTGFNDKTAHFIEAVALAKQATVYKKQP